MRHLHVYYLAWLLEAGPRSGDWTQSVRRGEGEVAGSRGRAGQVATTSQSLSVTFVIVVCCFLHTVGWARGRAATAGTGMGT